MQDFLTFHFVKGSTLDSRNQIYICLHQNTEYIVIFLIKIKEVAVFDRNARKMFMYFAYR